MGYTEIFLIAVSLAMDAFAVSVSNGLALEDIKPVHGLMHGAYFGFFQFLMPLIAFILLALIGGNMIKESFDEEDEDESRTDRLLAPGHMIMLAIATSIDALAVGISFSFARLSVGILQACLIIGCVSFVLPFCGVYLGKFIGGVFQKYATRVGGLVLIFIGIKILLEHLGIL